MPSRKAPPSSLSFQRPGPNFLKTRITLDTVPFEARGGEKAAEPGKLLVPHPPRHAVKD